jgi:hypothetical protein
MLYKKVVNEGSMTGWVSRFGRKRYFMFSLIRLSGLDWKHC